MLKSAVSGLSKSIKNSPGPRLFAIRALNIVGTRPTSSNVTRRIYQRQSRYLTMATPTPSRPLFTEAVVGAMRSLYPEELADRSWDNVGLLLDNVQRPAEQQIPIVLVTNDLTIRVAEEAIRRSASVIVSYHPFIFRPLKSVSLQDPHQRILLQLAQHNIAVYSPHTAVDAAVGGMNDWLADMLKEAGNVRSRATVQPIEASSSENGMTPGYGRVVEFDNPVNLGRVVQAYAKGLGGLRYLMVARPKHGTKHGTGETIPVRTVALCAGSGYDVLKNCNADVLFTGEMSHHSALKATMEGRCVVTAFHSNSERRFLRDRLQPQLNTLLRKITQDAEVIVSTEDEDPFEIWDVRDISADQ